MAKYYLGKNQDGLFIPITIPNLGTSLKEVVDYTTQFVDEQELRDQLFAKKMIDKWNTEIAYIKELGTKETRNYKVIDLGYHICTITSKDYFKEDKIKSYLFSKYYDRDFYLSLAAHYIRRFKVNDLLEEKLTNNRKSGFYISEFLTTLFRKSKVEEINKLSRDLLLLGKTLSEDEHQQKMNKLINLIQTDNESLIIAYKYFGIGMEIKYSAPIDHSINMMRISERYGDLDELSNQLSSKIMKDVESLAASIMYTYDAKEKRYKREGNKYKIRERGLVDLGLFISSRKEYLESIRLDARNTSIEIDDDHEEFLEESDFYNIDSSSEKEGYTLRKRDIDRK